MNWSVWAGFAAVCLWAASEWLVPVGNGALSGLERLGLGFAAIAVVSVALGGLNRRGSGWRLRAAVAAGGVLFFAVPALLIDRAREYGPETSVVVVFALAPVVVVLVSGAARQAPGGMRRLLPELMGLAGVLLLLPFEMPVSLRAWEAVAEIATAMMLVAGAGVWLYGLLQAMRFTEALPAIGIANAVFLLAWCAVVGSFNWRWHDLASGWWMSLASVIVTVLTVWLLQKMDPVRFAARFLVIPLVTILEGVVLLRPEMTARTVVGIALLTGGAAWILAASQTVDDEVLTLR
jgi:drug/metabolite transporter (DMT)-like permease